MAKTVISSGLGYSPLSEKVYWGKQNPKKQMWVGEKKDVTNNFIDVAHAYFEVNTIRRIASGNDARLFIHIKEDKKSIGMVIKELAKMAAKLKK